MNKYSHLSLDFLEGRFKYVLFKSIEQITASGILSSTEKRPRAFFLSENEASAIVSSDIAIPSDAIKIEEGWVCAKIKGDMPFGTVQGLIAKISNELAAEGIGVCVVSTYLTDWFFIKEKNMSIARDVLTKSGWAISG